MKSNFLVVFLIIVVLFMFACEKQKPLAPELSKSKEGISLAKTTDAIYVLTAEEWKNAQTNAVKQAGGTVKFSHKKSGVGIAKSSAPDFLDRVLASGAFITAGLDEMVEWQPRAHQVKFDRTAITPGDEPYFGYQWNMLAIEAPTAWAAGYTGAGVRVAVLDGGINSNHEEIAPNLDVGASASFVPGTNFDDDIGLFRHATHVAGIVAAADNGLGVIGVAPEATLIAVKVLHGGADISVGLLRASTMHLRQYPKVALELTSSI